MVEGTMRGSMYDSAAPDFDLGGIVGPRGPVPEASVVQELRQAAERLGGLVQAAEARLQPALRGAGPTPAPDRHSGNSELGAIASILHDGLDGLDVLLSRVDL